MLIVVDNDVVGAAARLEAILASDEWCEYQFLLDIEFVQLDTIGLAADAPDRMVWSHCQSHQAALITGNRAGGTGSLDEVIRDVADATSLPVITLSDPQRILHDRQYAASVVLRLLDYCERIETLRGVGRLFVP